MGLPIARQVVEAHHGRVWVESQPGEGATFSFTLPVAYEEASV
jgi:signal transduction histidine kinase